MAKVLVSTLGAGPIDEDVSKRSYRDAIYVFQDEGKKYETPFVSAALVQHLNIDKVILIGTGRSMWEKVYQYFTLQSNSTLDKKYWNELGGKVAESNYKKCMVTEELLSKTNKAIDNYLKYKNGNITGGSHCLLINYGINEFELWSNFDVFMRIESMLENGDEVYLDITHAFRSIPIFMYLMMDFIQMLNTKDIVLSGIYYGMLDISREYEGQAPVVDLKPLFTISKWIRGAHNFINYGNGYLISELVQEKGIKKRIRNISDLISINYLVDLRTQIRKLKEALDKASGNKSNVFHYIFPKIYEFTNKLGNFNSDFDFQLELAKWYFDNKRFSNGYICLLEAILTGLTELYEIDSSLYNERNMIKALMFTKKFRKKHPIVQNLYDVYNSVNRIRKTIAHAALDKSKTNTFRTDVDNTYSYYDRVKSLFNKKEVKNLPSIISLEEIRNEFKYRKR